MARFTRASLLPTALGVALLVLPASAAAANGGAAPTSTAVSAGASPGAAAPGTEPVDVASGARSGGAVPGEKPRVMAHHKAKARGKAKAKAKRKATKRIAKRKPKPVDPSQQVTPAPAGPTVAGVFPLVGSYSFGSDDARFGAGRAGHIHQGQDVIAASGTPIVAPLAGTVLWTANQPAGAGIYAVIHGADGRDYVFMHIKHDTLLVTAGDAVRAGEQIAQVGATGDASGPHLHFEIWVGGWGTNDGQPIDPLPQLQRWVAG
jgi:murein DD-endopeptidase MepM/ murein hydrolase activator NlpD